MLKQYIAFAWDINHDSGTEGGWNHVITNEDGTTRSWENKFTAINEAKEYARHLTERGPRIVEINLQIVDLHTGTIVTLLP